MGVVIVEGICDAAIAIDDSITVNGSLVFVQYVASQIVRDLSITLAPNIRRRAISGWFRQRVKCRSVGQEKSKAICEGLEEQEPECSEGILHSQSATTW